MNHALIEAAGWTMLHFLWQGALIGALFGLALALVRKPQGRYLAGCFALLTMLGTVAATFAHQNKAIAEKEPTMAGEDTEAWATAQAPLAFSQCRPCHSTPSAEPGDVASLLPSPVSSCLPMAPPAVSLCPPETVVAESHSAEATADDGETDEAAAAPSHFSWLVGSWLLGVILLSLRFFISWGMAQRLRGQGVVASNALITQCLRRIAGQIGVRRSVRALTSAAVTVPTVIGWLRPVVLLPLASVAGLSRTQLEAVLAHELAHIRRHDYLVNLLQHGLETLFFFHPAVWWVSKKIREEREHCCDDIAARTAGDALDYARALATLEEQRDRRWTLGMAANGGSLLARIRRLCGVEQPQRLPMAAFPAFLLLVATVIPLALVYSQEPAKPEAAAPANPKAREVTPEDAAKGLRHLIGKTPEPNIPFSDFAWLAQALDEKSIVLLLDEIGMRRSDGYRAWTRSALYAELARRDLDAALEHFRQKYENYRGIREQVAHALYVGSRPKDPWAALAYLRTIPDDPRFRFNIKVNRRNAPMVYLNADWLEESYKRLFKELATLDPERAWKELPGRGGESKEASNQNKELTTNYPYPGMVDGFFAGLKDRKTFEQFVHRFGPVGEPGTEPIAIEIAKNWMVHDIAAAQAWAPPQRPITPLGACVLIHGVEGNAAISWARENPKAALQAIRDKVLPKWNYAMAEALLEGDPHLASELVAAYNGYALPPAPKMFLPTGPAGKLVEVTPGIIAPSKEDTPPSVWYALRSSMRENSALQPRDASPEPGRDNRPLDYRKRYESYRAAIANDLFTKEQKNDLLRDLDQHFETHLHPIISN